MEIGTYQRNIYPKFERIFSVITITLKDATIAVISVHWLSRTPEVQLFM